MSLNFVQKTYTVGGSNQDTGVLTFYKKGFNLGMDFQGGQTPSWQNIILSGNTALTLVNAKANGLNYLKLFGATEQNGTPTPDNPIDIVSNNGVLKVSPNLFDVSENPLEQGGVASNNGQNTANSYTQRVRTNGYIPVKPNTTYTASVKDLQIYYLEYAQDTTYTDRHTSGFVNNNTTFTTGANTYFIRLQFRKSDNSVITPSEVTNVQLEQGSTATTYMPYGAIYTDGTQETVTATVNLFNQDNYLDAFCSSGGKITSHGSSRCYIIPCKPLTEYRFVFDDTNINSTPRCTINGFYDMPEIDMRADQGLYSNNNDKKIHNITFTTDAGINYLLFWLVYNKDDASVQQQVDKAILYETNSNSNTATAEMLLGVGDYTDVQEILSGVVTRNVGVKVLDGTENWLAGIPENVCRISWTGATATLGTIRYGGVVCSHFQDGGTTSTVDPNKIFFANDLNINFPKIDNFDTRDKCVRWLQDQYNAGTPVTILYPLAEPTTETVTGQPMTIQAGTNIVEITQASMDNLELEVSYKGTV